MASMHKGEAVPHHNGNICAKPSVPSSYAQLHQLSPVPAQLPLPEALGCHSGMWTDVPLSSDPHLLPTVWHFSSPSPFLLHPVRPPMPRAGLSCPISPGSRTKAYFESVMKSPNKAPYVLSEDPYLWFKLVWFWCYNNSILNCQSQKTRKHPVKRQFLS